MTTAEAAHDVAAQRPKWSLRDRLIVLGYRSAEALVSALPRNVDDAVAAAIAEVLVVTRPKRFRGLRANMAHVAPDATPRQLRRMVRHNARNWLYSWLDVLEMRRATVRLRKRLVSVSGLANYQDALKRGKGVVVLSLHYGTWEAGLAAWNAIGGEMALLAERVEPQALFEDILGSRGALGVHVIPLDVAQIRAADSSQARARGASAMREVMKHLKRGGVIAIAVDRDLLGNGTPLEFFGDDAPIPIGAIEIGIRAGAAIVPIVLERLNRHDVAGVGYSELTYDPDAPREQEVRRVTEQMLRLCEEVIRLHPEQWHVFDPIWPSDKKTA